MRHRVTPVPVTPSIISQVYALACLDGMPPSFKISIHTNPIFSSLLGLQEWITMKKSFDEEESQDEVYEMESEVKEYDDENEVEAYDKMDKNELAEIETTM